MKQRTEQQIDQIMECLGRQEAIEPNPMFAETVARRMSGIRVIRHSGYRSRAFYPVVILLLVLLNVAGFWAVSSRNRSADTQTYDQTGIIAGEYGIGQSGYTSF